MQLVILAVHGSDTEKHLVQEGWTAHEQPHTVDGEWYVFTKQVEGESSHSLSADDLTSEAPTATFPVAGE